jgi:hypothetical protein
VTRNVAEGERDSDRLAGETDISQHGYPEEAPPGADPSAGDGPSEDRPPREGAKAPRKHDDLSDETDDGKATGNPRSAG